jgi:hypothetical protein
LGNSPSTPAIPFCYEYGRGTIRTGAACRAE